MASKYDKFKFFGLLLLKNFLYSVSDKGPSLSARILNEKSAFSPATVVYEK